MCVFGAFLSYKVSDELDVNVLEDDIQSMCVEWIKLAWTRFFWYFTNITIS
jgi:hypothetical protein